MLFCQQSQLLRRLVSGRRAYKYAQKQAVEGRDERSIFRAAASIYQHGVRAVLFEKRAAKIAFSGYAVPPGLESFAQILGDTLQFRHYPSALPQQSSGEFLELMYWMLTREEELRAKKNRRLGNQVVTV